MIRITHGVGGSCFLVTPGLGRSQMRSGSCGNLTEVGDNVGDIAGMGADLFGSFAAPGWHPPYSKYPPF